MSYGIIEYNEDGLPKCEICGKYFDRVVSHVRQKHNIPEYEYKQMFGFDVSKGICSQQSAEKSRAKTFQNFYKCVANNLLEGGKRTRFTKGCKGRTADMMSEQTRILLPIRVRTNKLEQVKFGNTEIKDNKVHYDNVSISLSDDYITYNVGTEFTIHKQMLDEFIEQLTLLDDLRNSTSEHFIVFRKSTTAECYIRTQYNPHQLFTVDILTLKNIINISTFLKYRTNGLQKLIKR